MRIRRSTEFTLVLQGGRKRHSRYFTLHIMPAKGGCTRLGIIASRHIGNAIERNRAKRVLRETFRRLYSGLPPGLDLVAVAKGPLLKARPEEVEKAFRNAIERRNE